MIDTVFLTNFTSKLLVSVSKVAFSRSCRSKFNAVLANSGGHTVIFGYNILEIGNVSKLVEIGESFQSEKDKLMRIEAVVNPPMTTIILDKGIF